MEKRRLIFLVSILLIAGFLVTSLSSYFVAKNTLLDLVVKSEMPLSSKNIYAGLQKDLLAPVVISSMMANDTFLRDWVAGGEKNADNITRYLGQIRRKFNTISSFFVSEKTHTYYHADGILKTVKEGEDRDAWYFRVRDMEEPYEINVDRDMANQDTLTVFINYRVVDDSGNYIGAAGVGLSVSTVRSLIADYQKRYNRHIYFTNRSGGISLSGIEIDSKRPNIRDMEGFNAISDQVLGVDGGTFDENGGTFQYTRNGKTVLLNTRYIPELDWILFVEQSEDEVTVDVRNILYFSLVICLVVTVVVLLVTGYTINLFQVRLEKIATTDKLTGLANRQAFDILAAQTFKDIERIPLPLSVILFDIDHFKHINDEFGHLVGDEVIRAVAEEASSLVRKSDVICRWGGEEFLIWLRNCPLEDGMALAEKVRRGLDEYIFRHGDQNVPLAGSFGVAVLRPGEDLDDLLKRVDDAMYKAKHAGRNQVAAEEPL